MFIKRANEIKLNANDIIHIKKFNWQSLLCVCVYWN